jgi:hypothetical protein
MKIYNIQEDRNTIFIFNFKNVWRREEKRIRFLILIRTIVVVVFNNLIYYDSKLMIE